MFAHPKIRQAVPSDIPRLIELLGVLFSFEPDFIADDAKQRAGLELMLRDHANRCVLVAEDDDTNGNRVIGMCTAQMLISTAEGGPVALIEDVVVDAAYRRRGVGVALLAAIERWSVGRGAKRLQLLADRDNTPAIDFYKNIGWSGTRMVGMHKKNMF